jgi:hypothetical protein
MTGLFSRVPLDDPNIERFQNAHDLDSDPVSTRLAIGIAQHAFAAGHPGDLDAAPRALTGPPAAAAVQTNMRPFVNEAIVHDKAAGQHGAEAIQLAEDAKEAAERRRGLPDEAVRISDGSSQTRGQVQAGHENRQRAAEQRETRGDFEHYATQPGPGVRLLITAVLSLIEVFLLLWPVTNASWSDPKSVAYVAGLVAMFLFMNEQLPKLAGVAARAAREARDAAWELTAVGVTAGRAGDISTGREITGHVGERFVRAAERKKASRISLLAVVITVYAAVMFTRVEHLATGLGWSLPFVILAAALITAFTAGAVVIMAWWWSRGNALGDQLREYGMITDESRLLAEQLSDQSRADSRAARDETEQAHRQLDLGEQVIGDAYQVVGVGLQKAAMILDQDSVLMPKPENLFAVDRPLRARALANLDRAASILAEAQQILTTPAPFEPASPDPDPWETRTAPRRGVPNPAFVETSQLSSLHTVDDSARPWRSRRSAVAGVVLLVLAALAVTAILLHA